jgi:hypothetical protein
MIVVKNMAENIADSEVLLNRRQLERMLQKARLEGAIGYITYLCEALDEKKIKTLRNRPNHQRGLDSAYGAIGLLMMRHYSLTALQTVL